MKSITAIYELFMECNRTVCTDTRKIIEGSLFIALKGENFNGNLFAEQAIQTGAKYAIVDEDVSEAPGIVKVDNALHTLQQLANLHRKKMKAKVLGIAGSNGKTTTKELVSAVLSTQFRIQFTKGNLNNHIGVPFTLLDLHEDCEIAVVELGANHIGDVAELCEIAAPDLGIITNIGKEHLEGFGSIEGVAKAESELYDFLLNNKGHAFVNMDDVWLANMSKRLSDKSTYSIHDNSVQHYTEAVQLVPNIVTRYHGLEIRSHLMGEHNLQNIAAAIAIGAYFGISPENIAKGIANYKPQNNRSQIIETERHNTILLDAYNANPSSVESAIRTFTSMNNKPQMMLIGDMFELGGHAHSEHMAIAGICATFPDITTILVGKTFYDTGMIKSNVKLFAEKQEAMEFLRNLHVEHQNILIKGSRGMKMEDFLTIF